ncbi:transcriptional regulator [Kordiimonas sediminis]|uniref:Transcriptional regulator n=1 Tax=Kordiimonas sediminis TaxID=1735581 RepID=A0A919ASC2_9PROT|nr:BlaI/MecI/CopY family transcriptional regulator [Kordiimonas sediminis]GHF22976.1 transcriptional regulator [Kordiimonas sediminis]
MSEKVKLSDQQYQIVETLCHLQGGSARDVLNNLPDQSLAYTTVATILTRLEKKGVLSSETVGRERVYTPEISVSEIKRSMVGGLISTLFKGDSKALLAHLVREGDVDPNELEDLRQLLDKKEEQE